MRIENIVLKSLLALAIKEMANKQSLDNVLYISIGIQGTV